MSKIRLSDHFSCMRLIRFVLPSVGMMLITSLYTVVDGFFVSNLAGKTAFAALNLIIPAVFVLNSGGFLIGTGGTALISRCLGEGDAKRASRILSMLTALCVLVGVCIGLAGVALMPGIAHLLGADEALLEGCVLYGRILVAGSVFYMLQVSFQSFLIAAEKPGFGLTVTILSGVANMVMDVLLIALLGWGLAGAALATVIGQAVGALLPLFLFLRENGSPLRLRACTWELDAIVKTCSNGASEMLTNISASVVGMLYNVQLLRTAGEDGIAAYGVIMYLNFLFMAVFIGYSMGCAPVVGYHFGAGNRKELRNLLTKSLWIVLAASLVMTIGSVGFAGPLSAIFVGYDRELLEMTENGMRLYSLSFLMCGYNIFASAFFTALSNGAVSAAISFLRTFAFQVLSVLLLPVALGIDGIWLSVVAAEGMTLAVSGYLTVHNAKRYGYL